MLVTFDVSWFSANNVIGWHIVDMLPTFTTFLSLFMFQNLRFLHNACEWFCCKNLSWTWEMKFGCTSQEKWMSGTHKWCGFRYGWTTGWTMQATWGFGEEYRWATGSGSLWISYMWYSNSFSRYNPVVHSTTNYTIMSYYTNIIYSLQIKHSLMVPPFSAPPYGAWQHSPTIKKTQQLD